MKVETKNEEVLNQEEPPIKRAYFRQEEAEEAINKALQQEETLAASNETKLSQEEITETVETKKEPKFYMDPEAKDAVEEALRQEEPLIVSNAIQVIQANGVKMIFEGTKVIEGYKTLKECLRAKNKEAKEKSALKLVLVFDNSEEGQKLKNTLKTDLESFNYDFIVADWEDIKRSGDIKKAIDQAKERVKNILTIKKAIEGMNAAKSFEEFLRYIEDSANIPPIKTGFDKFDEALGGGLRGGRLYAIGAISSLGKTTFALNVADNIAVTGRDVLIFSLEMGKNELMIKSISRETCKHCLDKGTDISDKKALTASEIGDKFNYEQYTKEQQEGLQAAIKKYKTAQAKHIFISEGIGNIGVKQIREMIDNFKQLGGPLGYTPPVVIVDYMQILSPYNERFNDKQNIDRNITELKRISRDYNIPVIAISSFNRSNYLNEVSFESFKESGSIEYSADVLIGLQLKIDDRETWTEKTPSLNEKREKVNKAKKGDPRKIELIILKNRMYKAWDKVEFDYYPNFDYFKET